MNREQRRAAAKSGAPAPATFNAGQKRLKAARAEIEAVMRRYDIAGYCTLHAPNAGEVFWQIWPSYSLLQGDIPEVRIKSTMSTRTTMGQQLEQQRRAQTAQMVQSLAETMAHHGLLFLELAAQMNEKLGAEHTDFSFTSDPPPEALP